MTPRYIVIHCSDSLWGSAYDINKWHIERGFNDIGYHLVIMNGRITRKTMVPLLDGSIEVGRKFSSVGAHAYGYNSKSIGICLIGVNKFTDTQLSNLKSMVRYLMGVYKIGIDNVIGHYEISPDTRTCPNIDMDWLRNHISTDEPVVTDDKENKILDNNSGNIIQEIMSLIKRFITNK